MEPAPKTHARLVAASRDLAPGEVGYVQVGAVHHVLELLNGEAEGHRLVFQEAAPIVIDAVHRSPILQRNPKNLFHLRHHDRIKFFLQIGITDDASLDPLAELLLQTG